MNSQSPEITVIGGGTGSFTLLQELKKLTPNLNAVVNMSDDGGSTGELRDEMGVLPPGDVRQCLVALSNLPDARDLFNYRFGEKTGKFAGHSVGNLILSALELRYESFTKSIEVASRMLDVRGQVIPVTTEQHQLVMQDGQETIYSEHLIGHREIITDSPLIFLEPAAKLNPKAAEAITVSDLVVIAPGNLYGSLLPTLVVDGMKQALQATDAHVVLVTNLVTKTGQTDGWHVADYLTTYERYIGTGTIDTILYNDATPDSELIAEYAYGGDHPLRINEEGFADLKASFIGAPLVANETYKQDPNDVLTKRTLIRHDAKEVGRQLMRLYSE